MFDFCSSRKRARKTLSPPGLSLRREGGKITWTSSRETLTGSVMVVIITAFAAIFFLIIDQIFSFGLDKLIGLAV